MMSTPPRTHLRRTRGERGASLIIALVFISVFGLILMALGDFAFTNVKASGGYRSQRATNYATDAALDAAVNRMRNEPTEGRDPALFPTDECNPANGETMLKRPGTGDEPTIVVSCVVVSGSGSGEPAELGSASPYALLTLGDRRTDVLAGTPTSIGVRSNEPAPFNGNVTPYSWFSGFGDPCPGDRAESGMRLNKTVYPWVFTIFGFPIFADCAEEPSAFAWNVRGNVFSNSKIVVDTPSAVPTMIADPDTISGTIKARGGCIGSGFGAAGSDTYCTDAGWNFDDGEGKDPGLVAPADYAPRSLDGLTVQSIPPASQCTNTRRLVTFQPGIYTDATALNALFGNADCKNATFWFTPGAYYFDFRNTTTSYQCGTDQSNGLYDPSVSQDTQHQWCIGGAANDYGGQRVIGGTPYNWSPTVDPTTHEIALEPLKAGSGPGTFFGLFPQPTQFTNGDNCPGATTSSTLTECGTLIDTKTVNYAMSSSRSGSSIWLSNFPDVPRGAYNGGIDLQIAHAAVNRDRMNAPSIQVDYQYIGNWGLKATGTCGPYTLDKPPANGAIESRKLSEMTNGAAMAASLSTCLNNGDKINSAVVRYNANRPSFQGSPYATAKLDGVKLLVTAQDQPTFPRPPSEEDEGGDCDPEGPGVQFIFGGDSRVYIPNGGLELCAGPNPTNPGSGQQIAVYGVPATPRLVPTSASGGTNPNNAKLIAEVPTLQYATIGTGQAMTLAYPGFTTPSGYNVASVQMRASYDASSAATVALQSSGGSTFSGTGCTNSVSNTSGVTSNPVQTKLVDVTACLTASNRLGGPFQVRWQAGGTGAPRLDGVEFIVTLAPTNENTHLRPQHGCITASPNLWYGTGSPDCSVVRVDGPIDTSGNLLGGIFGGIERRGRLSVKGSIYAPSASIDIDDEDVWYPIAERGIVARHLRIRGFKYHDGYFEPAFNNWLDKDPASRSVVFLACAKDSGACTSTDDSLSGRAAVSYTAVTSDPQIEAWTLGKL
jgi:hypothetical protein